SSARQRYAETTKDDPVAGKLRPEPGRAFWLVTKDSSRINTGSILGRSVAVPFTTTLDQGWNQIGSPYDFAVEGADSTLTATGASGPVTLEPPQAYEPGIGYVSASVLRPFEGYWLLNETGAPVNLTFSPVEFREPAPAGAKNTSTAPGSSPRGDGWWQLEAAASLGGERVGAIRAGVHPLGREGGDVLDRSAPPLAPGQGTLLYFASSGASPRRLTDVRAPIAVRGEPD